jgi:hypothetical protein
VEGFLNDFLVVVIYGAPGILLLLAAPFVARSERIPPGPRWLLVVSMAVLGATWVWAMAYWWLEYCWETWQPCDGSTTEAVTGVLLQVSAVGLIAGIVWALVSRRAWKVAAIGVGVLASIGALVGIWLVFIDDPDGPDIDARDVEKVVRPHLVQLTADRSLECRPTDVTDVGVWRCQVKGTARAIGPPVLIRVRADGRYFSREVSGCCIEATD